MKFTNASGFAAGPTKNQLRPHQTRARSQTCARSPFQTSPRAARAALALLLLCACLAPAPAQGPQEPRPAGGGANLDAPTRRQVIEALLRELNSFYVFPEKAREMEKAVGERAARGEYDRITDAPEFARILTEHLQAVSRDKHLVVHFSAEPLPEGMGTRGGIARRAPDGGAAPAPSGAEVDPVRISRGAGEGATLRGLARDEKAGIERVERLEGNVGLIEFSVFERLMLVADKMTEAMNKVADTDALIIDLRENKGGGSGTIRLLLSYFFDKPVHVNDYYDRVEDHTQSIYTLAEVPGKRYGDKPVYILTSGRTFSAAEGLSFGLQDLKRATVIGERTAGGAHPTRPRRLTDHFAVAVPSSRYISAVTGTDWEGTGVKPDVEVPAEQALRAAHLAALKRIAAANPSRAPQLRPVIERLEGAGVRPGGGGKN